MNFKVVVTSALAGVVLVTASSASGQCAMPRLTVHSDPARTAIFASDAGENAIYFHSKLGVNTDGASRSYHPDDPRGRTLALNNVGNAITDLRDAQGRDIDCTPRSGACFTRYISTFEAARDAGWNPQGHPRVATSGIIPWRREPGASWATPCRNADGYFVSQTAFLVDPGRDECDQGRYLDAMAFNALVLPGGAVWRSQGWKADQGDLVVVRDRTSDRLAFAVVGDTGPRNDLGEGSVALAAALAGRPLRGNETYQEVRALHRTDVDVLVFNRRELRRVIPGAFSQADVDRLGLEAFDAWGGRPRLDACRTAAG